MISLFENAESLNVKEVISLNEVQELFHQAIETHPDQWLFFLELFELAGKATYETLKTAIKDHLYLLAEGNKEIDHLIHEGIELIENAASEMT